MVSYRLGKRPRILTARPVEGRRRILNNARRRQTEELGAPKKSTVDSTESIDDHQQQQRPLEHQDHKPRHEISEDHRIVVISVEEKLNQAGEDNEDCSWSKLSSYRIPRYLKDGRDKNYVPQLVSLGPYYHGDDRIRQMDWHKWRCLHCILRRANHKVVPYLNSVKEVEKRARDCYEGTITMSSDEFAEMMVLDGCFVIELFQGFAKGFEELGYSSNDPVFSLPGSIDMIRRDMIMLENQIPLFILDLLFRLQRGQPDHYGLLAKLAVQFFYPLKPTHIPFDSLGFDRLKYDPLPHKGELPCLELFRQSLLHPGPKPVATQGGSQKRQQLIHCVTELLKLGVKFEKVETDKFWDIGFENGTLKIPQLVIQDGTMSLFLNLIAFEQCHLDRGNEITSYVVFMDHLINSSQDVGHLHDRGIIEHWLGSDAEVAELFNQICKGVIFDIDDSYLSQLSEELNTYSGHRWHGWIANLKLTYFSNPWSIISVVAAFILLVLTFAQTFYAVYGYYTPRS